MTFRAQLKHPSLLKYSHAVDNRRPGLDFPGVGGDRLKTAGSVVATPGEYLDRSIRAFSSEVDTGSREENASKQESSRAPVPIISERKGSSEMD
jgi:hypothetical protein